MADIFPVAIMLLLCFLHNIVFLKAWGEENKQNLFQKMHTFCRVLLFIFIFVNAGLVYI